MGPLSVDFFKTSSLSLLTQKEKKQETIVKLLVTRFVTSNWEGEAAPVVGTN